MDDKVEAIRCRDGSHHFSRITLRAGKRLRKPPSIDVNLASSIFWLGRQSAGSPPAWCSYRHVRTVTAGRSLQS